MKEGTGKLQQINGGKDLTKYVKLQLHYLANERDNFPS